MLQPFLNGVIAASVYGLAGMGFILYHRVAGFFDFSYAASFVVAPYVCWGLLHNLTVPNSVAFWVCASAGIVCTAFFALATEQLFRYLRVRSAGALVPLLVSLGVYIVVQNAVSILAGDDTKTILARPARLGHLLQLGSASGRITDQQLIILLITLVVGTVGTITFYRTKIGLALRAVADDSELSRIEGLNVDAIHAYAQSLGSAVCGIAGICHAVEMDLNPTVGLGMLLKVAAAMVIGGSPSLPSIMLGALAVGLLESFSPLILENRWQDTVVFGLLLVLLLARRHGLVTRNRTESYIY